MPTIAALVVGFAFGSMVVFFVSIPYRDALVKVRAERRKLALESQDRYSYNSGRAHALNVSDFDYWNGRRDEARFFRNRLTAPDR